ncbi:MAG: histidine kinase [Gammaproteobacteria bacterium]
MSLRTRLNLLLSLIFFLALFVAVIHLLANTRQAVTDELQASSEFASLFITGLHDKLASAGDYDALVAMVERLGTSAPLRHLRISVISPDGRELRPRTADRSLWSAPNWFHELVRPDARMLEQRFDIAGATLIIVADPDAEIGEAWRDVRASLTVLLIAFCGASIGTFVFLGRALRPLRQLSRGLEGVGQGYFATRLSPSGIPDIDRIVGRFNDMVATLERSEHDNAVLARRSLAIQENERRHLAHELHDEMGQSITAIKALAVSIQQRTSGVLAERAGTIVEVSSDIYTRVRRMMTRLHPVVLDELGLVAALELMVDDWNVHHEDCFCEFDSVRNLPEIDGDVRIAAYRTAQEALTNIARHAGASTARIELRLLETAPGPSTLSMVISDNGRGFAAEDARLGLGLRGIRERIQAAQGELRLKAEPGAGVRIEARFPLDTCS